MCRGKQMMIKRYNPYEGEKIKDTNTAENKIPLLVWHKGTKHL